MSTQTLNRGAGLSVCQRDGTALNRTYAPNDDQRADTRVSFADGQRDDVLRMNARSRRVVLQAQYGSHADSLVGSATGALAAA